MWMYSLLALRQLSFPCLRLKVLQGDRISHPHCSSPVTRGAIYTTCLSKAILYPHNLELPHLTLVQSTRQPYVTVFQALDMTTSVWICTLSPIPSLSLYLPVKISIVLSHESIKTFRQDLADLEGEVCCLCQVVGGGWFDDVRLEAE